MAQPVVDQKKTLALDVLTQSSSLADTAFRRRDLSPEEPVITEATIPGTLTLKEIQRTKRGVIKLTRREFHEQACQVAHFLLERGLKIGDRVVTLPGLRHEWLVIREGIRLAGGVHVAIFSNYPEEKISHIIRDSEPKFLFFENQEHADKISRLIASQQIPSLPSVAVEKSAAEGVQSIPYSELVGKSSYDRKDPVLTRELHSEDLADINYTSGTTKLPKGVVQTHGNHLANTVQITESDVFSPGKKLFPLLRPAHSYFLRMADMGTLVGGEILLPAVTDRQSSHLTTARRVSIQRDVIELGTEVLATAPAALEAMFDKVCESPVARGWAKYAADGKALGKVGNWVLDKARARLFPSSLQYVISGGARLTDEIRRFFSVIGVPIHNGYGATEADVVVATNTPSEHEAGTVGKPLAGVGVELIADREGHQEIVVSGPQVAKGYWKLPEATQTAFRDGKYHTGDTGSINDQGYLSVTGRLNDVVKLENGEKIALEGLEEQLKELCPSISKVIVFAEAQRFCTALVIIDEMMVRLAAKRLGAVLPEQIPLDNTFVQQLLRYELAGANAQLPEHHTRIRSFHLIPTNTLSEQNGTIGPTLKLVRHAVRKLFTEEIARMSHEQPQSRVPDSANGIGPTPPRTERWDWKKWIFWWSKAEKESA